MRGHRCKVDKILGEIINNYPPTFMLNDDLSARLRRKSPYFRAISARNATNIHGTGKSSTTSCFINVKEWLSMGLRSL